MATDANGRSVATTQWTPTNWPNTFIHRRRALDRDSTEALVAPLNRPQVEYFDKGDQWCPKGDVLRCVVTTDEETGETAIIIDDQEFSLDEFGKMMSAREGWGMRIAFVEEDELHRVPKIEVREPDENGQ